MNIIAYEVSYNQGEDHGILLLKPSLDFDELNKSEIEEYINLLCIDKYDSEVFEYKRINYNKIMLKDLTLGELKIYLKCCINAR